MKDFLILIDSFNINKPNGEAISTLHLANSLDRNKVIILAGNSDQIDSRVKIKKFFILSYLLQLYFLIKNLNNNFVLFINSVYSINSFLIPIILMKFIRKNNYNIVVSPRGMLSDQATTGIKKRFYLKFIKVLLNKNVTFQVSNQKEFNELKKNLNPKSKIVIFTDPIPEPPKTITINRVKNKNLKIIYFGRLSYVKNIEFAYKVFKLSSNKFDFDVYGEINKNDINYFNKCDKLLKSIKNVNYSYNGHISYNERLKVLTDYDLCFVPSFSENFCHTIYDSLSVGTPVLTTDGVPWEEINNYEAGKLIPLKETQSFVEFLESFDTMSDDKRIQMRQNAHSYALKFYLKAKEELNEMINTI